MLEWEIILWANIELLIKCLFKIRLPKLYCNALYLILPMYYPSTTPRNSYKDSYYKAYYCNTDYQNVKYEWKFI